MAFALSDLAFAVDIGCGLAHSFLVHEERLLDASIFVFDRLKQLKAELFEVGFKHMRFQLNLVHVRLEQLTVVLAFLVGLPGLWLKNEDSALTQLLVYFQE